MSYTADKLRKGLDSTDGPVVVDVRSKREYRQSHIPGAIHLSFWAMPFRFKSLYVFRDKVIIVYCEHGPRAVFARQVLLSKGFAKVECLDGQLPAWRRSGYPVVNK